jgi:hypothetical protein
MASSLLRDPPSCHSPDPGHAGGAGNTGDRCGLPVDLGRARRRCVGLSGAAIARSGGGAATRKKECRWAGWGEGGGLGRRSEQEGRALGN